MPLPGTALSVNLWSVPLPRVERQNRTTHEFLRCRESDCPCGQRRKRDRTVSPSKNRCRNFRILVPLRRSARVPVWLERLVSRTLAFHHSFLLTGPLENPLSFVITDALRLPKLSSVNLLVTGGLHAD